MKWRVRAKTERNEGMEGNGYDMKEYTGRAFSVDRMT